MLGNEACVLGIEPAVLGVDTAVLGIEIAVIGVDAAEVRVAVTVLEGAEVGVDSECIVIILHIFFCRWDRPHGPVIVLLSKT